MLFKCPLQSVLRSSWFFWFCILCVCYEFCLVLLVGSYAARYLLLPSPPCSLFLPWWRVYPDTSSVFRVFWTMMHSLSEDFCVCVCCLFGYACFVRHYWFCCSFVDTIRCFSICNLSFLSMWILEYFTSKFQSIGTLPTIRFLVDLDFFVLLLAFAWVLSAFILILHLLSIFPYLLFVASDILSPGSILLLWLLLLRYLYRYVSLCVSSLLVYGL